MITKYIKRYKYLLVAGLVIPLVFCAAATEKLKINSATDDGTPFMEIANGDSITLSWDPPLKNTDSVASYDLSYHTKNNLTFVPLKNIPKSVTPTVVIRRNEVPATDSIYYFRIRSILKSGMKSDYHNSSDPDAIPEGGWFLYWR